MPKRYPWRDPHGQGAAKEASVETGVLGLGPGRGTRQHGPSAIAILREKPKKAIKCDMCRREQGALLRCAPAAGRQSAWATGRIPHVSNLKTEEKKNSNGEQANAASPAATKVVCDDGFLTHAGFPLA